MKNAVRNWIDKWKNYLFGEDDLISYYTFFTMIFAECAFLWSNYSPTIAKKFTLILLAYVINVLISSFLKGYRENEKEELLFAIMYVVIFAIIFIIGFFINILMNLILIAIPLIISFIWIKIREMQNITLLYQPSTFKMRIVKYITDLFSKRKKFYWGSQLFLVGLPFVIFVCCLASIHNLPIIFKILIPLIYLIIMPYISVLEDVLATCNIFQIAYDITWDKEYEEWRKQFEDKNLD